jgi:hypothetical protein
VRALDLPASDEAKVVVISEVIQPRTHSASKPMTNLVNGGEREKHECIDFQY